MPKNSAHENKDDEDCQILSPAVATDMSKSASEINDNIIAESHLPLENDFIRELTLMEEDMTPLNTLRPPLVDIYNRPYSPSPLHRRHCWNSEPS